MADFINKSVGNGIEILSVPANQFKTNEIALSFFMPLKKETAAVNAIVPMLLSRCSADYPSLLKLNTRLAQLYGAELLPSVSKMGELQQLKIGITALDDRFSLDNEKISTECVKLLLSLFFEPALDENGCFIKENIETEKRVLTEKIESEENEKRLYVLRRAEEVMFEGEPYAVNRYGSREDVSEITPEAAFEAWKNILKSAKVLLTVVGSFDSAEAEMLLKDRFSAVERDFKPLPDTVIKPEVEAVKTIEERIDVKQGKLVMGFRVDADPKDDKLSAAMRSFSDIFGGGPYSKLFANVREKMSLCYYCSSRYTRLKGFIMVQSGCEEENMEKAQKEILNQLEEIKNGNFDYEFNSSKIGLTDAINSVCDAPESLEAWYTNQCLSSRYKSPAESAAENNSVTKEQIMECAKRVKLDTVYKLVSTKEAE